MAGGVSVGQPTGPAPPGMRWDATLGGYVPNTTPTTKPQQSYAPPLPTKIIGPSANPGMATGATAAVPVGSAARPLTATPASAPTFQAAAQTNQKIQQLLSELQQSSQPTPEDPRIADTMRQLTETASGANRPKMDFSELNGKTAAVEALLKQLMEGKGLPPAGDIATDPAAAAFRIARKREAEQARNSEADRLGASGVTGSGAFDSQVAGINENAGQDIAGFEGNLANTRHGEQLTNALSGANLQLQDIAAQRSGIQAQADAESTATGTKIASLNALLSALLQSSGQARSTAATNTASKQQLLNTLLESRA